jgi:hypothetical protein
VFPQLPPLAEVLLEPPTREAAAEALAERAKVDRKTVKRWPSHARFHGVVGLGTPAALAVFALWHL